MPRKPCRLSYTLSPGLISLLFLFYVKPSHSSSQDGGPVRFLQADNISGSQGWISSHHWQGKQSFHLPMLFVPCMTSKLTCVVRS